MQPVVDLTCPPMERLYDVLIIIALLIIMIQLQNFIEQSMLMRYYQFYEENCVSLQQEWMIHFDESIQSHMRKLISIHRATGECIMKEKIAVIRTVLTKRFWNDMIMARMKPKNITRKYSKESLEKLSSYGRRKVQILSNLRK